MRNIICVCVRTDGHTQAYRRVYISRTFLYHHLCLPTATLATVSAFVTDHHLHQQTGSIVSLRLSGPRSHIVPAVQSPPQLPPCPLTQPIPLPLPPSLPGPSPPRAPTVTTCANAPLQSQHFLCHRLVATTPLPGPPVARFTPRCSCSLRRPLFNNRIATTTFANKATAMTTVKTVHKNTSRVLFSEKIVNSLW